VEQPGADGETTFAVNSVDCAGQALFFQAPDNSWTSARTPGGSEREPFSTGF